MPFGDYTQLSGFSHSMLRNGDRKIKVTEKMSKGAEVDNYLLEPEKYDSIVSNDSKVLARALKLAIGDTLWNCLQKQLAVTADFFYNGLTMPFKGRIDLSIVGRIVLDVKVTESDDVDATTEFLGYKNQLTGYAMGIGAPNAMLISINAKKALADKNRDKQKYITRKNIPLTYDWWKEQIINHGY